MESRLYKDLHITLVNVHN